MQEIYDFFQNSGVYFLATLDDDAPKVRPFHTMMLKDDKLYFQTDKNKDVYHELKNNSNIQICALYGDLWLRISANVFEANLKDEIINEYPDLKITYKGKKDSLKVFGLDIIDAKLYSYDKIIKQFKV